VGQKRMLREVSEAVEQMSVSRPIVMVLEDLHWSDPSTIAWLEFFARRRRAARVMVIATFREVASLVADHPLRIIAGDLPGRYCHEIALRPLNVGEVADCVAHRISADADGHATLGEIGLAIHRCTEGNPLFVANVVDTLLCELTGGGPASRLLAGLRALVASSRQIIPATIGEIITQNFARLNQYEQSVIEIASVAGMQFSAAAIAAGAQASLLEVEECCSALANRKSFLGRAGEVEWPDGTVAAKFRFQHSLYRPELGL
jgi:predicted ATPase